MCSKRRLNILSARDGKCKYFFEIFRDNRNRPGPSVRNPWSEGCGARANAAAPAEKARRADGALAKPSPDARQGGGEQSRACEKRNIRHSDKRFAFGLADKKCVWGNYSVECGYAAL